MQTNKSKSLCVFQRTKRTIVEIIRRFLLQVFRQYPSDVSLLMNHTLVMIFDGLRWKRLHGADPITVLSSSRVRASVSQARRSFELILRRALMDSPWKAAGQYQKPN